MDVLMKRSLWLFIIVGVLLLLVGAALYSACAGLGHSISGGQSYGSWDSVDGRAADLLIAGIAAALAGWFTVLLITRYHHRNSRTDCPICRHHIHVDDHACNHCGSRFA